MKKAIVRLFVCLLCTCLLCVSVPCPDVHAADAPQKPQANDEVRHTVCHALSAQAQAYYADTTAYSALCALPGAAAGEDSAAAMQNNALFDALHALMAQTHTYYTTYNGYGAAEARHQHIHILHQYP